jgi:hypothetical protein
VLCGTGISAAERARENADRESGKAPFHFLTIFRDKRLLELWEKVLEMDGGADIVNGGTLESASAKSGGYTMLLILLTHGDLDLLTSLGEHKRALEVSRRAKVLVDEVGCVCVRCPPVASLAHAHAQTHMHHTCTRHP